MRNNKDRYKAFKIALLALVITFVIISIYHRSVLMNDIAPGPVQYLQEFIT